MKKGIIFSFVGVCALLLVVTGCGNKETKLVCTQSASGVDITFNWSNDLNPLIFFFNLSTFLPALSNSSLISFA